MKHNDIKEEARKYHYWRGFRAAAIPLSLIIIALVIACNVAIDALLG